VDSGSSNEVMFKHGTAGITADGPPYDTSLDFILGMFGCFFSISSDA
jgi:hypothetical protein